MKKISAFFCSVLLLLLLSSSVRAQTIASPTPVDYQLPYPGLLPDHPLYPLKRIRDRILYLLASDPVKKIELGLLFADKKIGMGTDLLEKGETNLSLEIIGESQMDILQAASPIRHALDSDGCSALVASACSQ